MNVLVTGSAGFIGFHLCKKLLEQGYDVWGFDNLNSYYEVSLKLGRLKILSNYKSFRFIKADLKDKDCIQNLFKDNAFDRVVHLAAQAGVKHSIKHPEEYIESNILGFFNILEACRNYKTGHLLYASSSSVYGLNSSLPFSVNQNVDHPASIYGATKKTNELLAHSYSYLFGIPTTGLRFFTVYGPWGRPDMALYIFTKAILEGMPIKIYNNGESKRSFTYIDDIVRGIIELLHKIPQQNSVWNDTVIDASSYSSAPYRIYNIGNDKTYKLMDFIEIIENKLGLKAEKEFLPLPLGDIEATYADVTELMKATGFAPSTSLEEGISNSIDWYLDFYKAN